MRGKSKKILPGVYWMYGSDQPSSVISETACISATGEYIKISNFDGCIFFAPSRMRPESQKWLAVLSIDIRELMLKYHVPNGEMIWPLDPEEREMFGRVFSACDSNDEELFRVYTSELLIKLARKDVSECIALPLSKDISPRQAVIARAVHDYLISRMDKHITIDELSSIFGFPQTLIKESYKKYYGKPIHKHIRDEKLRNAAYILKSRECAVAEVASMCGYSNSAKFSKAFSGMFLMNPSEYKKQ